MKFLALALALLAGPALAQDAANANAELEDARLQLNQAVNSPDAISQEITTRRIDNEISSQKSLNATRRMGDQIQRSQQKLLDRTNNLNR